MESQNSQSAFISFLGTLQKTATTYTPLLAAIGFFFTGTWVFVDKLVFREMDKRDQHIARLGDDINAMQVSLGDDFKAMKSSIDQNFNGIRTKMDSIEENMGNNTNKLSDEINRNNNAQTIKYTKLESSHDGLNTIVTGIKTEIEKLESEAKEAKKEVSQSREKTEEKIATLSEDISKDISEVETEAKEANKKAEKSIVEISAASAVTSRLKEQEEKLQTLDITAANADHKHTVLEEIREAGIVETAVQQAYFSVLVGKLEDNTDTDTVTVTALLKQKEELTPSQLIDFLTTEYSAGKREAMLIAYDELTVQRSVDFFLDIEEIKENMPPEIAAALPEETANNTIEKALAKPQTIVSVCADLDSVPNTGCYEFFRKRALLLSNRGVITGARINEAALRAIENKYSDQIISSMDQ